MHENRMSQLLQLTGRNVSVRPAVRRSSDPSQPPHARARGMLVNLAYVNDLREAKICSYHAGKERDIACLPSLSYPYPLLYQFIYSHPFPIHFAITIIIMLIPILFSSSSPSLQASICLHGWWTPPRWRRSCMRGV
ncbi:hypothetical protein EON64_07815 [archaeon]|nr:MAG: hypothetical protein EON64_07815 [archaeon]